MESTMNLTIGFKGSLKLNAQSVPLAEGYLKLGGIVGDSNGLEFGRVVSADSDEPSVVYVGNNSGNNVVRGISVFDDAIAQNAPAHANKYLADMPCAFINKGLVKIMSWVDGKDPIIGHKVEFDEATGEIGFVASSADSGFAILEGAKVVDVTNDGAYIWLS